jgi:hypothetical protein
VDLNLLLQRHQLALMRLDRSATAEERRSHEQFVRDYAEKIRAVRMRLGATSALRGLLP